MSNKWIAQAYGIDALVDDKGEILASVRAGHGDYTYKGRSFIDRASAKNAVRRLPRRHGMTTPSLPNYSAGAR